jgi:hypothetical protein
MAHFNPETGDYLHIWDVLPRRPGCFVDLKEDVIYTFSVRTNHETIPIELYMNLMTALGKSFKSVFDRDGVDIAV